MTAYHALREWLIALVFGPVGIVPLAVALLLLGFAAGVLVCGGK